MATASKKTGANVDDAFYKTIEFHKFNVVVVGLTIMNNRISRKIEPTSVPYQEPTTAPKGLLLLSIPKFLIFF